MSAMHYATEMNTSQFGVRRSRRNKVCWKQHFFNGLVNTSWKVLVEFSPNLRQWCIMGERWVHYILGSKSQRMPEPSLHRRRRTVISISCRVRLSSCLSLIVMSPSYYPVVFSMCMTFYPRDAMLARVFATATCPSVRTSVCHTPVLWLAEWKQYREMYTIRFSTNMSSYLENGAF